MEVIRSEFLDRENIQKFWDEKMNVEKTPGLGVEKAYLAALSDLEQEKIIQEKNLSRFKGKVSYGFPEAITSQSQGRGQ
ncbi:hypothetical protein ACFX2I_013164 [Malus domestica]